MNMSFIIFSNHKIAMSINEKHGHTFHQELWYYHFDSVNKKQSCLICLMRRIVKCVFMVLQQFILDLEMCPESRNLCLCYYHIKRNKETVIYSK